ncbi:hypothetical protein BHM03_00061717 [Ensete ventricosum]|nr:hypothetical protein BHM03_00061717 [Ensete ventricosum]
MVLHTLHISLVMLAIISLNDDVLIIVVIRHTLGFLLCDNAMCRKMPLQSCVKCCIGEGDVIGSRPDETAVVETLEEEGEGENDDKSEGIQATLGAGHDENLRVLAP